MASAQVPGGFSWSGTDRTAVVAGFARHYLASEQYREHIGWNGDVDTCMADSLSAEFLGDTLRRINWFRAQAGVASDITTDPVLDERAQAAALIMARQGALSHHPATDFPGNPCLSDDGNLGAANSNLVFGAFGPGAINYLMKDPGLSNGPAGHRRWNLFTREKVMGNGAIPNTGAYFPTHAQYVFGSFRPSPPAKPLPWPNAGFIPWQVVPDESDAPPRWSFGYPGADFSGASVTVESVGDSGGLLATSKESVVNGYGDNTLVWQVHGMPHAAPDDDTTYHVVVSGVAGTPAASFPYDVTVIDPYVLGLDLTPDGPPNPPVGKASPYGFASFPEADGYTVRVAHASAATWTEGAEDQPSPQILDGTSQVYELREPGVHATGDKSFHLTAPAYDAGDQSFTVERIVVPGAASAIRFKVLRHCMSTASTLFLEVSRGGEAWKTLWSQIGKASGVCAHGRDWDAAFQSLEVPVPGGFDGETITLRFRFAAGYPAFLGVDTDTGVFVDDLSMTGATELVDAEETALPAGADGFDLTPVDGEEAWLQVRAAIADVRYEWSRPLVVTPGAACGDANQDGKVTAADALFVLKAAVAGTACPASLCDANGNGSLSATDALLVLRSAVGAAVEMKCPAA